MIWVLVGAAAWVLVALVIALVIGRAVRVADTRAAADAAAAPDENFVVDPHDATTTAAAEHTTKVEPPAVPPRRSSAADAPTVPGIPVARPSAVQRRRRNWPIAPSRKSKSA